MGVHGLWRLIEPSGKEVPLETLENKVLAVDISIWLHQAVKGFQDAKGAALPNAHLLGIYHRVCKLLYFKIKPVFVFDGGVPALKKQTIAKRNQLKSKNSSEADRLQKQLLSTLLQHTAISKVLSEKTKASIAAQTKKSPKGKDELFALPSSSEMDSTLSSSSEEDFEDDSTDSTEPSPLKQYDLHSIDTKSPYFLSLPLETRHEILTELKETRKQSSWGRLHELPKKSDDFSSYQMKRLLKRQQVQAALDETGKEMGGASLSLTELESLLKDQGIPTSNDVGQRIASDSTTRFLYIKDVKEALEKAKLEEERKKEQSELPQEESKPKTKADLEEEEELQRAIALSLQDEPSTSCNVEEDKIEFSFLDNFRDEDFESDTSEENLEEVPIKEKFSSAQSYMMEYSGLTPAEISKIISQNARKNSKKGMKFGKILPKAVIGKSRSNDTKRLEPLEENIERECDSTTEIGKTNEEISEKLAVDNEQLDKFLRQSKTRLKEKVEKTESPDILSRSENDKMETEVKDNSRSVYKSNKKEDNKTDCQNDTVDISDNKIEIQYSKADTANVQDDFANEEKDTIEVMSDTESSSSEEFIIVEDAEKKDNAKTVDSKEETEAKLVIVPEKIDNDDDLFSDIFEDRKDFEKLEEILSKGKLENAETDSERDQKVEKAQIAQNENLVENRKKDFPRNFSKNNDDITTEETTVTHAKVNVKDNEEIKANNSSKESTEKHEETKQDSNSFIGKNPEKQVLSMEDKTESIKATDDVKVVTEFKAPVDTVPKLSVTELQEMKDNLQREKIDLLVEKSSKERLATNISDQMYQEAQELLQLFGVPYVVAPMEAEAQCAFLDEIELTDGTITDDSDIWLFGGRTVYKNFFNQAKYVMEFKAENIKHHFKLTRQQMILLALLVGSDYTIGVRGVGPVTALEILSAFPPSEASEFDITQSQLISGLKEFKAWFTKGQTGGPGRSSLKTKLKNITFTENFPNVQVVQAYMEPTVETSRETFSWCKPDFVALTLFAREKLGWSSKKTEEILNPVIKRVEESRIQKSIKEYFKTKFKLHNDDAVEKMSKRVKMAIERFGKTHEELIAEEMELLEKEKQNKLKKNPQVVEREPTKKKRSKKEKADSTDEKGEENNVVSSTVVQTSKKGTRSKKSQESCASKSEESVEDNKQRKNRKKKISQTSDDFTTAPPKKSRNKNDSEDASASSEPDQNQSKSKKKSQNLLREVESLTEQPKNDPTAELKLYENVAVELRQRRRRQNELLKLKKEEQIRQRNKEIQKKFDQQHLVDVPQELEADKEIQHLLTTTMKSVQKVEEIHRDVQKELSEDKQKRKLPVLHTKDVIHQKLRDKSDVLRNKLKAIEVYRKSKKGPGYVPKRGRLKRAPKEDAGLSEDSDS